MATNTNKRSLPAKIEAMKSRKRLKVADGDGAKQKSSGQGRKTAQPKTPLPMEALGWKDVSLPDRLEDYEGFFGLEEVDDVEIIRDSSTGNVAFVSAPAPAPANGAAKETDDDEWTGFDDEAEDLSTEKAEARSAIPKKETKQPKKAKKVEKTKKEPKKEPKKATAQPQQEDNVDGVFKDLGEVAEGDDVDVSAWRPLGLSPDTMAALAKLNFSKPTPIQISSIPEILAGHDVIGKASTGSGKTLAFGIPVLERFLERPPTERKKQAKAPLAMILSPTRELAHQIGAHLTALCSNGLLDGPLIATITGGLSVQKQQRQLKDADIVIGTPGRLWEIISGGQGVAAALRQIQFLIIDEADRLLSEGHYKEVEEILNSLDREEDADEESTENKIEKAPQKNAERQTLIFSATFDRGLQKKLSNKGPPGGELMSNKESMEYLLSKLKFREETPKFVDVNPINQLATGLKEGLVECAGTEKDLYLYALLLLHSNCRTLVFTNSISAVRRITPYLQMLNLPAIALHSGMVQKARLRSVERFTGSKENNKPSSSIMVATDVAARGLDIANVQLVIHYHLPRAADMYVHRSGRTARAGQTGSSILICGPEEVAGVRRLIAKVHAQSAAAHNRSASEAAKQGYYMRTLDMDRRIVSRLKPRATLAKKIADTTIAKEKQHKEDDFMRAAAEELGVDYDSEEFEKQAPGKHGRGSGRVKKERQARELPRAEVAGMKAELKELLRQRVNVGVSEKYITSGRVDVDELLKQQELGGGKTGEFLGGAGGIGLD